MSVVTRVWRDQPGKWFFVSTKDRSGAWKDHPFKRSQFGEIDKFVDSHSDKDVYFCPHGFKKPRRLKRFAEIPKLLWADLDEADPREMPDFLPSIAWESSPGRYAAMWRLTSYMTEDLCRRLTYHLKADPGGWDLTQVLRFPGSTNHKYESKPRVKILWIDGPEYDSKTIEKRLPKERKAQEHDVARGLYRKYESVLSGWVRRQLFKGKPQPGKRSEVLWRLTNELLEAGMTRDEAFELLRVSPWNKFVNRRNGDEQLRRELDKAVTQHIDVVDDEERREAVDEDEDGDEEPDYKFLSRSMAEVEEEQMDWVWYPYLARGEVTILEGDPGLGKSYLAQMVASHVVDGKQLPSVKKMTAVQGKVAYFDIENASGAVTKKRLVGNGCTNLREYFQEEEPFTIDDDETLDRVYDAIETLKPTLMVFDTINTYMGGADLHNSGETQQAFKRFLDIARRFKCAVMVLRHLTKSTKDGKALYRGQGSIAFAGLARFIITVGKHPEDPEVRVAAVTKINVARTPKALTFRIDALPDTLKEMDRSKFEWGEFVDLTADEIIVVHEREKDEDLESTCEWLREVLTDDELTFKRLCRMGEPRGMSAKQIEKALVEIGAQKHGDRYHLGAEEKAS